MRRRKRSLPKKVLDNGGSFIDDLMTLRCEFSHTLYVGSRKFLWVNLHAWQDTWLAFDLRMDFASFGRTHLLVEAGGVRISCDSHLAVSLLSGSLHRMDKQLLPNAGSNVFRSHPKMF